MRTMRRFTLEDQQTQIVEMPGGQPIHAELKNGKLFLWALVDPNALQRAHTIYIRATGEDIPGDTNKYLGNFHPEGAFTDYHVFEGPMQ